MHSSAVGPAQRAVGIVSTGPARGWGNGGCAEEIIEVVVDPCVPMRRFPWEPRACSASFALSS